MNLYDPKPSEIHRRRWPRITLPTFDLAGILAGHITTEVTEAEHACDFEDGMRFLIYVAQSSPGQRELLHVTFGVEPDKQRDFLDRSISDWARLIVDRLVEIDLGGRPRIPLSSQIRSDGCLHFIFSFDRAAEETAIAAEARREGIALCRELELYTIYENPADYAGLFVLRRSFATLPEPLPGGAWKGRTLEEARGLIPRGKVNIGRFPQDDPVIVEVWT